MRNLIYIYILFLHATMFAQDETKLQGFKAIVLNEYSEYFSDAVYSEGGKLQVIATPKYINSNIENKQNLNQQIISSWQDSTLLVSYDSKRELWLLKQENGITKAKLIDTWDYGIKSKTPTSAPILVRPNRPYFFYVGGQMMFDNQANLNLGLNLRFGYFLLKNRWDLASTFSGGISGNTKPTTYGGASSTPWTNLGLMSRVHFPIKQTGFSPNIGAEISIAKYGDTDADVKPSFVLGFTWFTGVGSIDIGLKLSELVTGMGGYTMYPAMKR